MLTREVGTHEHLRAVAANRSGAGHDRTEGRRNRFKECAVFLYLVGWVLHRVKISILCALYHSLMPSL